MSFFLFDKNMTGKQADTFALLINAFVSIEAKNTYSFI